MSAFGTEFCRDVLIATFRAIPGCCFWFLASTFGTELGSNILATASAIPSYCFGLFASTIGAELGSNVLATTGAIPTNRRSRLW